MEYISDVEQSVGTNCCRVCLIKVEEFHDLFDGKMLEEGATIAQILRECTSYTVEPSDNLSRQICRTCYENACFSYRFRRQADASYRYLTGITGQPQKSTMLLVEQCTQTDPDELLEAYKLSKVIARKISRPYLPQQRHNTPRHSVRNDCPLCGKHCRGLLDLREHLMSKHTFDELMRGLQCRLCDNQYSRKDHVVRHLRNIHKVSRDRGNGRITIDKPQTEAMGQIIVKMDSEDDNSSVSKEKTEPVMPTTTVHRYWHTPEFVPSGKNTHTYKLTLPKLNYSVYDDPLISNDGAAESYDIEDMDDDSKAFISLVDDAELSTSKPTTTNLFASTPSVKILTKKMTVNIKTSAIPEPQQQQPEQQEEQPLRPRFQCSECQRCFFRKYHLQRHMIVHSKVRAYVCELCKRCFARNDQFLRHRKDSCKVLRGPTRVY